MEIERIIALVVSHLMFILGLSELIQAKAWARYLEKLLESEHSVIMFTPILLIFGLVIVDGHNIWVMGPPVIVTIFGWLALVKCTLCLMAPQAMLGMAKKMKSSRVTVLRISGVVMIVLGTFVMLDTYSRYG